MGIKNQNQALSTPQYSKSSSFTDKTMSYTAPAKSEHMERPLHRTASPAKMANKVTNVREEYHSPHSSVGRVPSTGRQDTYGEAAQQEPQSLSKKSVRNLSFTSPQYSTPPPSSTSSNDVVTPANGNTPYSYATHYDAENSPMWLSSNTTTGYNPRQYEDSLIDTVQNMSLTSPVNRVADGAEQPDGSFGTSLRRY